MKTNGITISEAIRMAIVYEWQNNEVLRVVCLIFMILLFIMVASGINKMLEDKKKEKEK